MKQLFLIGSGLGTGLEWAMPYLGSSHKGRRFDCLGERVVDVREADPLRLVVSAEHW